MRLKPPDFVAISRWSGYFLSFRGTHRFSPYCAPNSIFFPNPAAVISECGNITFPSSVNVAHLMSRLVCAVDGRLARRAPREVDAACRAGPQGAQNGTGSLQRTTAPSASRHWTRRTIPRRDRHWLPTCHPNWDFAEPYRLIVTHIFPQKSIVSTQLSRILTFVRVSTTPEFLRVSFSRTF
jgi:hypothetical protein